MSTMILSPNGLRHALPAFLIIAADSSGAAVTDNAFMDIKQENFSSVPKMSFTGLKALFYCVSLSAYDENGLEGDTGVYDIFYYPSTTQAC